MRGVFASLFGVCLLSACSPVPIAGTWPVSVEQRMQSVSHWQFLAHEEADKAQAVLPPNVPVFIALNPRAAQMPFGLAFHEYLKTEFVQRHYTVVDQPRAGYSEVHWSVQAVPFDEWKDPEAIPGLFTTLGFAAWLGTQGATHWGGGLSSAVAGAAIPAGAALDIAHGALATPTDSEVIVTVEVTTPDPSQANRLVEMRDSKNFYVAGADLWHYRAPSEEAPGTIHPRVVGYNVYE